ncbi:putative ATPase [Kitasatospora gansuensis]|uniref:Putative ATPase n=1 Tax=Kitasatospora gansuensis TaxID=258050 RepID=A0A7W7S9G4_9ACTN|nr:AAA family ATPase [Kitasatospora gansuensis]MBB4945326.1 putative ATPase [Kitasatospora gansuensis]
MFSATDRLPAELTSFVGREAELAGLAGLLRAGRLVTVTGPGGVGKTRLALRAAAAAAHRFADGVRLVEVGAVQDPLLLGHAVLEALRLTDSTARPPEDVLVEQLADRELLIVLDSCEHLVAPCAELVATLLRAAPGLRVLATSRETLRVPGEHRMPVSPLPVSTPDGAPAEAVRLFADRAAAVLPGFELTDRNLAEVTQLCRRLDGIPLAVELAAGRLRALSVEQIALRLNDRFRLLTGGDRSTPERHQTLRTTIGWSHELCTPQERLTWARLSVFSGSFDLESAEYVCVGDGLAAEELLDLIGELIGKSVLLREEGELGVRYRLLDTLREYGAQWLRATGEEYRLRCRHRDWYLGMAGWGEVEWFGPRQQETAERTRLAHPNLRTALEFCLAEPGEEQLALLLAGTLWFYWVGSGHLGEGRHWLDRALALAPEPTEARAKALWVTGYMATLQGDLVRARPALAECHRQALETGDDRALAYAVHRQGCAALIGDELGRATELFEDALWHYDAIGELNSNVLMAMFELGVAYLFQGETESGLHWLERVRETCEEHGEQWAYAYGLYAMAYSNWTAGELRTARAHARECVRLNHLFRDLLGVVLALDMLAVLETEGPAPDLYEARVLQGAAHRIWRAVGKPFFGSSSFTGPYRTCEERTREGLTEQEFGEAFGLGAALDLDQVAARVLGREPVEPPRNGPSPAAERLRGSVPTAGQRE